MAASVFLFRARKRPAPPQDWTNQDRAEFLRVVNALARAGMAVELETGLTDEGEPWAVFCPVNGDDPIVHIARIDGSYVVCATALQQPARGTNLTELLKGILQQQSLVLPLERASRDQSGTLYLHPAALLVAVVATSYCAAFAGEAAAYDRAIAGSPAARAPDDPDDRLADGGGPDDWQPAPEVKSSDERLQQILAAAIAALLACPSGGGGIQHFALGDIGEERASGLGLAAKGAFVAIHPFVGPEMQADAPSAFHPFPLSEELDGVLADLGAPGEPGHSDLPALKAGWPEHATARGAAASGSEFQLGFSVPDPKLPGFPVPGEHPFEVAPVPLTVEPVVPITDAPPQLSGNVLEGAVEALSLLAVLKPGAELAKNFLTDQQFSDFMEELSVSWFPPGHPQGAVPFPIAAVEDNPEEARDAEAPDTAVPAVGPVTTLDIPCPVEPAAAPADPAPSVPRLDASPPPPPPAAVPDNGAAMYGDVLAALQTFIHDVPSYVSVISDHVVILIDASLVGHSGAAKSVHSFHMPDGSDLMMIQALSNDHIWI